MVMRRLASKFGEADGFWGGLRGDIGIMSARVINETRIADNMINGITKSNII